jgi:hypothetical protein
MQCAKGHHYHHFLHHFFFYLCGVKFLLKGHHCAGNFAKSAKHVERQHVACWEEIRKGGRKEERGSWCEILVTGRNYWLLNED